MRFPVFGKSNLTKDRFTPFAMTYPPIKLGQLSKAKACELCAFALKTPHHATAKH